MNENPTSPARTEPVLIAVPVCDGAFSEHFGAARQFSFFLWEGGDLREKGTLEAPEHRPGVLPVWLSEQGIDAVVVSAIGERALIMLADAGIEAFIGEGDRQPSELASDCARGLLPRVDMRNSRCHGHHDGHHDDCHH